MALQTPEQQITGNLYWAYTVSAVTVQRQSLKILLGSEIFPKV
jgi:hypothetical protein